MTNWLLVKTFEQLTFDQMTLYQLKYEGNHQRRGKECEGSQRKRISLGLNVGSNEVARSQSYKTFFIVTEHKLDCLFLEF